MPRFKSGVVKNSYSFTLVPSNTTISFSVAGNISYWCFNTYGYCKYLNCSKWYSGYGGWECCPSLIWITKSFDKMIKPTKIKNALTVSDADFFFRDVGVWRCIFDSIKFFRGWWGPDDREMWVSYRAVQCSGEMCGHKSFIYSSLKLISIDDFKTKMELKNSVLDFFWFNFKISKNDSYI